MTRADRLHRLSQLLRDGTNHRAADLARAVGATPRTIYRDLRTLKEAGLPLTGTRGTGYRITADVTLPPLSLTMAELEALHLGLVAVARGGDAELGAAATAFARRLAAALPEDGTAAGAPHLFSLESAGTEHQATLRLAVRARQKLALTVAGLRRVVRPLRLDYWGRLWSCVVWDETLGRFDEVRLDQIGGLEVLPNLFVTEPGKDLASFDARA